MKKLIILIIVLAACTPLLAQDELKLETRFDFYSQYVWRGQSVTDDPVFQPSVSALYRNFTFSAWGNLETTKVNDNRWKFTETDFTIDYSNYFSKEMPKIGYSFGLINYDFPNTDFDNTTELYAGINVEMFLNPYVKVFRDIDEVDGTYVSVGISESLWLGLEGAASLGWGDRGYNDSYWGTSSSKANDLVLSISRPIEFKGMEITPSLSYIKLMDKDLGSIGNDGNDIVIFGFSLSKKF
jgi:hypothetical protein